MDRSGARRPRYAVLTGSARPCSQRTSKDLGRRRAAPRARPRQRRVEPAGGEQHVAVEPEVGDLRDETLVALAGARRARPRRPPRRPCAQRAAGRSASSPATYEPSGRVVARSATRRQSQGAKHETEPVWHAGPSGRTRSEDRVAVAVVAQLLDGERVAGRLALSPEPLARAAEEVRLAGLARAGAAPRRPSTRA